MTSVSLGASAAIGGGWDLPGIEMPFSQSLSAIRPT